MPPRAKISKKGRLPRKNGKRNQKQKEKEEEVVPVRIINPAMEQFDKELREKVMKRREEYFKNHPKYRNKEPVEKNVNMIYSPYWDKTFQKIVDKRRENLKEGKTVDDYNLGCKILDANRKKLQQIIQAASAASAPAIASPAVSRAASAVPSRQASAIASAVPSRQASAIASAVPSRQASAIASAVPSRQASAIASAAASRQASRQISRAPSPPPPIDDVPDIPPPPPIDDVPDIPPPPPIDDVSDEPERPKRKRKVKHRPKTVERQREKYFNDLISKTNCKRGGGGHFAYYNKRDEKKGVECHYRYLKRTGKWYVKIMSLTGTSMIELKRKPRVITGLYKTKGNRKKSLLGRKPKGQQTLFQAWGQK